MIAPCLFFSLCLSISSQLPAAICCAAGWVRATEEACSMSLSDSESGVLLDPSCCKEGLVLEARVFCWGGSMLPSGKWQTNVKSFIPVKRLPPGTRPPSALVPPPSGGNIAQGELLLDPRTRLGFSSPPISSLPLAEPGSWDDVAGKRLMSCPSSRSRGDSSFCCKGSAPMLCGRPRSPVWGKNLLAMP